MNQCSFFSCHGTKICSSQIHIYEILIIIKLALRFTFIYIIIIIICIKWHSGDSPETLKNCLSTKFPQQEIRWNFDIFCSDGNIAAANWTHNYTTLLYECGLFGWDWHFLFLNFVNDNLTTYFNPEQNN